MNKKWGKHFNLLTVDDEKNVEISKNFLVGFEQNDIGKISKPNTGNT